MNVDFSNIRALVVGDLMLDHYIKGNVSRISPEAPVPVVKVHEEENRPGGAANVALNLTSLGVKTNVIGWVGNDEAGKTLVNTLKAANIECHVEQSPQDTTIVKQRVLSQHQQLMRLDFESTLNVDHQKIAKHFEQLIKSADVVILSDYNKGVLDHAEQLIQIAKQHNIPVIVDPKKMSPDIYRNSTMITPNMKEFESWVGPCSNEASIHEKGMQLIEQNNLATLLITRSEKGMSLLQRNQAPIHIPAHALEVFDVTGAGDTVIATLAAAVASGKTFEEAARLANTAASIVVGKLGAATVNPHELRRALMQQQASGSVVTEEQLQLLITDAKAHNETVVMTNGCFDILHAGHVHYLNQAKALGHRLIVAVNSDDSVKKLKGHQRPINTLENRMAVLSALSAVDWVVPFSEETPERLISTMLPDILVKGGDYKPEDIAGAKAVLENNGKVEILDFVDGVSTSMTIERIQNATQTEGV